MDYSNCWYKDVCNKEEFGGCHALCHRFLEMNYLMEHSHIPKARQGINKLSPSDCDLGAFNRLAEIKADIYNFISDGKSVYICGNVTGNGKTSWAIKLMQSYFNSIWYGNGFRTRGLFVHVPTFLLKCKDFKTDDAEFEQLRRDILTADVVIWDDICGIGISAYDYSQLLMYLDARCNEGLSNIFTSNITTYDDVSEKLANKIASRIFTRDTEIIELKGGDRR